jgi:uncharacterized membrane protein
MILSRTTISIASAAAVTAIGIAAPTALYAKHKAAAKPAKEAAVHCYGINTCKGTSDCATAKTSCKGQNECKGQGFKALTASKCAAAGGSTTAPAA